MSAGFTPPKPKRMTPVENARDNHRVFATVMQSYLDRLQREHDQFYREAVKKHPELRHFLMGYQHCVSSVIQNARASCRLSRESLAKARGDVS